MPVVQSGIGNEAKSLSGKSLTAAESSSFRCHPKWGDTAHTGKKFSSAYWLNYTLWSGKQFTEEVQETNKSCGTERTQVCHNVMNSRKGDI